MSSIDKKDRRILRELDRNARVPFAVLAKRLEMPQETVRYRVQGLIDSGVIQNFLAVIDGGKLGFYYYKIFFKFFNVNDRAVQNIIAHLAAKKNVTWIVRVDGTYDIGFTINARNPLELSILIEELRSKYSEFIHRWIYSVNIQMDFLTRDYLTGAARAVARAGSYSAFTTAYPLDTRGWELLAALSSNPRGSAVELSAQSDMNADTVSQRLRKLEKDDVVVRYTLVLDNNKLGQINNYVLIFLSRVTNDRRDKFVQYCKSCPNITYIIKSLGEWDFELSIETANIEEYRKLMMDMTTEFSDIIRDYNGMMVRKIHKYIYP